MEMILFKDDWSRFPTAIVDTKTSNKSFLKLAHLYRDKLKVKNWKFILTLLQSDLQGVDPFDPDLDEITKAKILMECKYNPWYYFREISRVPPNSGNVPIRFKANRGNIAMYWSFFNNVDFGLLQPRQTGKSVSTDVLNDAIMNIWGTNTTIQLVTKDAKLKDSNMQRLKEMRDLLPDYIDMVNRLDADNSEMLTNVRLNNRYKTAVARNDKIGADKLGRGLTVPIIHFDELAYISLIEHTLPVALASASAARDEAREAEQYYGNIFTTTAGNITTRDGKAAHDFLTGGATWDEAFFDLPDKRALHIVVAKGSTGTKPLIYGAFNHRQLGRTDEWLYHTLRETGSHGEVADRDFFNIWTIGGEGSPFSEDIKKQIKASEMEPQHTTFSKEGYTMRWYISEEEIISRMASGRFLLGTDPSELLGEDNDATGLVLIDVETHEVIYVSKHNETSIPMIAGFIAELLIKYPNITWVPERKSATGLIDFVILTLHKANIDPFRRIFNRVVDESSILVQEFKDIQTPMSMRTPSFYDRFKRHFGYATAGSGRYTRNGLYLEALPSAMKYGSRVLRDRSLILELLGLVLKNGRIDHKSGKGNHDDMVISMLLAHWVCIRGQNLNYYGIDPMTIFRASRLEDEELTPVQAFKQGNDKAKREEFDSLLEELKGERNQFVANVLEARLRKLSSMVNIEEASGVGIDALLKQTRDDRSRRVRTTRINDPRQVKPTARYQSFW